MTVCGRLTSRPAEPVHCDRQLFTCGQFPCERARLTRRVTMAGYVFLGLVATVLGWVVVLVGR